MKTYLTDWLGFPKIFYNEKTGAVNYNVNKVIDYNHIEFDPDGLQNYLDFGYSVFGQTPVKYVKFLLPNSELKISSRGITIIEKEDPVGKFLKGRSDEDNVIDLIRRKIQNWELIRNPRAIIIPTSGGYDSRLLNLLVKNKRKIRSFSYGISEDQCCSQEVVYAEYFSKQLKTKWKFIPLTHICDYIDDWYRLYGISTHCHGMYHLEFYDKIHRLVPKGDVLSGIMGDAWSGNVKIPPINDSFDVAKLGYSHNICADSKFCKLKGERNLAAAYLKEKKNILKDSRFRIIESMRFKSILLSYLIRVPEKFGYRVWSPFLDIEVATAILKIPAERLDGRAWQRDFFRKNGVFPEDANLKFNVENTLDIQSIKQVKIEPLDVYALDEIIDSDYVNRINQKMSFYSRFMSLFKGAQKALDLFLMKRLFSKFGFNYELYGVNSEIERAYNAYMVIKPLELLMKRRKGYG